MEGYNSMLHGFPTLTSSNDSHEFPTQIFYYVSTLINLQGVTFSQNMVRQLIDLYVDLAKIYTVANDREVTSQLCMLIL